MHEICYNRVSGQFGGSGSPSCCQKFRQHFMSEISATISKITFFWRKKCKNWHFRLFILGGKGVRLVRNFFLGWSTLVRSKTPWQTKKTSGTSPAHWESILTSQDRKKAFFPIFLMKISHFWSIFAGLQGALLILEISSSNKSSKIYLYEGRTQKSATFDPPNPRSQTLARQAIFKPWSLKNSLSSYVLRSRIWGGQMLPIFERAPHVGLFCSTCCW